MSLPSLLLVDDSEAVLAFERAALSGHYQIATASNGREALEQLPRLMPAAVLLDLSMPEMDGDEVLQRMQQDPQLQRIPVIVISSETKRAERGLEIGARAFLPKPLRAQDLLPLLERVLAQARADRRVGELAVLFVCAGPIELGLPLDAVSTVLHQTATQPLPLGPAWLREMIELHGAPVAVLDLPRRLGVEHARPLVERKLVVVDWAGARLALCVDEVRDPEEISPGDLTPREQLGGSQHGALQEALLGVVKTPRGLLPVVDPRALLSPELLRKIAAGLGGESAA